MKRIFIILAILVLTFVATWFFVPGLSHFFKESELLKKITGRSGTLGVPDRAAATAALKAKPKDDLQAAAFIEPGIEKIKSDLIGHQVPGWSFDKPSEFQKAVITSIARTDQSIEFRTEFELQPFNAKDQTLYNLQVIVTYLIGEDGWYFYKVEEISFSFEPVIPPGKPVRVASIKGCRLMPDDKATLFWTSKGWDYEIISGPKFAGIALPYAEIYEVRSKSKQTVKTRVTYKPDNAPD